NGHGRSVLFGHLATLTTKGSVTAAGHQVTFVGESRVVGPNIYALVPKALAQQFGNPTTPWVVASLTDRPDLYEGLSGRVLIEEVLALPAAAEQTYGRDVQHYSGRVRLAGFMARLPADLRTKLTAYVGADDGRGLAALLGNTASFELATDV